MEEQSRLIVECEDCKNRFRIGTAEGDVEVHHKKKYEVEGQSIYLTYYDCPRCGRRHVVQIDTWATLENLKNVEKQFIELAVAKTTGKRINRKQSDKFKNAREHLTHFRNELMKQYTGKLIHDSETDFDFELRFSI